MAHGNDGSGSLEDQSKKVKGNKSIDKTNEKKNGNEKQSSSTDSNEKKTGKLDDTKKKRKAETSSYSEMNTKQQKQNDALKNTIKKGIEIRGSDNKSPNKHGKISYTTETKQETNKILGAFVQTIEKVLTQYDGEKDRDAAFKKLQKDYLKLLHVRQTEPEELLEESNRIAKETKFAHDDLHTKLRQQVANLTKKLDKYEKIRENIERAKARIQVDVNDPEAIVTLKQDNANLHVENESLRKQIETLEEEMEHEKTTKKDGNAADVKRYESTIRNMSSKLNQSNKLLEIYQLLTSLHVNVKSSSEDLVAVSCRAIDSLDSKQFSFDLKIPQNPRVELEYMPAREEVDHHRRQTKPTVPDYLMDELTFQRSELTRFMRTILEAVIRKKS